MEFLKGIIGLALWAAIVYGIYYFVFAGPDDPPAIATSDFEQTLGNFATRDKAYRDALIQAAIERGAHPEDDLPHFIACMGDFAVTKLETLIFNEVFGWCETERENNRERFTSHYNELDAEDDKVDAWQACKRFVEAQLKSPSTADHPTLDFEFIDHPKGRWTIRSYVDAQNSFGAEVRAKYVCETQYTGGDSWRTDNWTLLNLEIRQ